MYYYYLIYLNTFLLQGSSEIPTNEQVFTKKTKGESFKLGFK